MSRARTVSAPLAERGRIYVVSSEEMRAIDRETIEGGVPGTELNLSLYITNHSVGLFVRGRRGTPLSATRAGLQPRASELERALGAEIHAEAPLLRNMLLATTDPSSWSRGYEWLRESEAEYLAVLASEEAARK